MSSLAKRVIMPRDEPQSAEEVRPEELRLLEAMLFASAEPLDEAALAARLPAGVDLPAALTRLQEDYAIRGVNLVRIGGKWTFRTASDLSWLLSKETIETRKLSRAAIETLAIIAYHQPVTRTEIEEIRGVSTSKGSVDVLLETGWIRPRGRRKAPGRPVTYGTTDTFLSHFGLDALDDLPGVEELQGFRIARWPAAARLLGADAVRRSGLARGRGSAGARRPRSRFGAAPRTRRRRLKTHGRRIDLGRDQVGRDPRARLRLMRPKAAGIPTFQGLGAGVATKRACSSAGEVLVFAAPRA